MLAMLLVGTLAGAVLVMLVGVISDMGLQERPFDRRPLRAPAPVGCQMQPEQERLDDEQPVEHKKAA